MEIVINKRIKGYNFSTYKSQSVFCIANSLEKKHIHFSFGKNKISETENNFRGKLLYFAAVVVVVIITSTI